MHLMSYDSPYVACSVSSLMTTTEAIVVELPKDEKDIGAMGGMDY